MNGQRNRLINQNLNLTRIKKIKIIQISRKVCRTHKFRMNYYKKMIGNVSNAKQQIK
jgi:hypothetical protein